MWSVMLRMNTIGVPKVNKLGKLSPNKRHIDKKEYNPVRKIIGIL